MNARASALAYRVDWFKGSKLAFCFGFNRFDKAFEKFVEGVNELEDDVCMYRFNSQPGEAVLIARFTFHLNKRKVFNASAEKRNCASTKNRST